MVHFPIEWPTSFPVAVFDKSGPPLSMALLGMDELFLGAMKARDRLGKLLSDPGIGDALKNAAEESSGRKCQVCRASGFGNAKVMLGLLGLLAMLEEHQYNIFGF